LGAVRIFFLSGRSDPAGVDAAAPLYGLAPTSLVAVGGMELCSRPSEPVGLPEPALISHGRAPSPQGRGEPLIAAANASWSGRLPARKQPSGVLNGLDDLHIARATADVAAERGADLGLGRVGIAAQEADGGHHEARCAIAALGAQLIV